MTKYEVTIKRKDCIQCGNCYGLDPEHFMPDEDYTSMVVGGKTSDDLSKGTFQDDLITKAKKAAEECPMEIITVEEK